MSGDLARLFLASNPGTAVQPLMGGTCTVWTPTGSYSTIVVGSTTYTNLPILNSALATMGTGLVLLINTPRGPLVLGRLTVPV
jgi:hypothetical protein